MPTIDGPRILLIDIEMLPNVAFVWRLFKNYVGPDQISEPARVLCFSAKWYGEDKTMFFAEWDDRVAMIDAAWELLDQADIVCHFNGTSFDLPWLNGEFLLAGLKPPAPYKQIDLLTAVRRNFNFPSTRLGYLAEQLGLEGKVKHSGLDLWKGCMNGDPAAQKHMKRYNKRDVVLLEEMYTILQPWIPSHPSIAAFCGTNVCPACGGHDLQKRGYAYSQVSRFQRFLCKACGKYSRSTHRDQFTEITAVTS